MIKQSLLLFFISGCSIWNSAKAQSYSIESFEGQKVNIQLTENVSGKSWYVAKISCLTDSLFLGDYNGVQEVHLLSHNFLEIVYNTPGGTGSLFRNTLILSVKKNKINVALLADSYGKAFGDDIDGSLYIVKFKITGNDKSNFNLIAHIYDRHRSNLHPQMNYIKNKQIILDFDPNRNIFYSAHKRISQSFTIGDSKVQSKKLEINDTLPVIVFDLITYYYIKGAWYKNGNDNILFREYYN